VMTFIDNTSVSRGGAPIREAAEEEPLRCRHNISAQSEAANRNHEHDQFVQLLEQFR
jgi:hypothetical protein